MYSKKVEKLKLMIEVSLHKLWKILFRNRTGISFIIHAVVQPKGGGGGGGGDSGQWVCSSHERYLKTCHLL